MTDRITLEDMVFYGYHGALEAEKQLGQRFIVKLSVSLDLSEAAKIDDLSKTVNYSALYQLAREVVEGTPKNLIEAVAGEIAERTLAAFPVEEVMVRIAKPAAPIKGATTVTPVVEIVRRK